MSKTPVSTLQEFIAKHRWEQPDYTLIANTARTGDNVFTYRVTCGSMTAVGTGTTKKDAKHAAARELLDRLPDVSNFVNALKSSEGDLQKIDSYYLPGSKGVSHEDIFVNSVGKLNEYCVTHKLKSPKYQDLEKRGPPHAPRFTVICSIGSLEVQAVAATKKKCKHDAARAMLDKLVRNTSYKTSHSLTSEAGERAETETETKVIQGMEKLNMLDLKLQMPTIAVQESEKRAKRLYPSLENYSGVRRTPTITKPNGTIGDSHLILKSSYEPLVRIAAIDIINENQKGAGPSRSNKQEILNNVMSLLGLSVEYDILSNTSELVTVGGKLNTSPTIMCAGIGITYLDARDQVIAHLLESIDIFLS